MSRGQARPDDRLVTIPVRRTAGNGYPGLVESTGSTPRPEESTQPGPPAPDTVPGAPVGGTGNLVKYLIVYTVLRLGLVIVLTAVLAFFMPLIVALLFAIILQLPLAWLLFTGPRSRVNDAMAVSTARRREERERLQSALSGEPTVVDAPPATRQPLPGAVTDGDPAG